MNIPSSFDRSRSSSSASLTSGSSSVNPPASPATSMISTTSSSSASAFGGSGGGGLGYGAFPSLAASRDEMLAASLHTRLSHVSKIQAFAEMTVEKQTMLANTYQCMDV